MGKEKKVVELSRIERNSAACALEWSIELEKALRSKKPGRAIEAIQQIGTRLERWSREPESTASSYNMFGLVAGEDRVFANTILLRLSDAFKFGNRETRYSIVRIFSGLRHRKGKKLYKGIFSKGRVQNHQELLNRVKFVFDSGDSESKALAMFLFGCWADFAKDSAQIRYLILSSLVSSHSLEVKASLFAAACFSELADDFSRVVLEMVVNIAISSVESSTRLAGARVFAKLGCSYSVAKQAYETGLRVLLEASDEDFLVAMLVSLTKLASKSMLLSSEQVKLVCSFLTHEQPQLQETSFKCLHFLFKRGVSQCIDIRSIVRVVINVLDNAFASTVMQCEALGILHKILLHSLSNHSHMEKLEFSELLTVLEKAFKNSLFPTSLLAIRILMDISMKITGGTKHGSDGNPCHFLQLDVRTLIMDHSTLLVKQLLEQCHKTSELPQEVQSQLYHLILLIEHLDLDVAGVEKVCLSLRCLAMVEGDKNKEVSLRLASVIYRYVGICIEYLNKSPTIGFGVFEKVKHLVDSVCRSTLFNCGTNTMYSVLLHSKFIFSCLVNEDKEICDFDGNSSIKVCKYIIKHEVLSIAYARKLLLERFNWQAYIAGTNSTSNGGWLLASFIFGNLVTKVSSNSCCFWLKSLDKFSLSELKIQLLPSMLSNDDLHLAKQHAPGKSIMLGYSGKLFEASQCLHSASKMLEIAVTPDQEFCFQRWFLYLRAKTVATLGSVFKVLGAISFNQSSGCDDLEFVANDRDTILKLLQELTNLSLSLKMLALEFDLVLMSFIGMDSKSSKIISELGLSCSLLALCTGFVHFVPELSKSLDTTDGKNSATFSSMLLQNLVGRLWSIDDEMAKNMYSLLIAIGGPKKCLHLQSRNQILDFKCEGRDIIKLCRNGIDGIVCLQNEARGFEATTFEHVTKKGMEYLSNILMKWMRIPFKNPKHFFSTRPCIRSELFALEEETRKTNSISICSGHQLSLSLCLQLKHYSSDRRVELEKFYCILFCKASFKEASGDQNPLLQAWQDDDIIEMSEKLSSYVTELRTNNSIFEADNKVGVARTTVQMEVNERGQGFSSCLLDVSEFPVGCYRVKWFSCCVDRRGCYWSLLPVNAGPVFSIIA